MKSINERFITFSPKSARLPYPEDLELGQDITVTIGTFPFIYNVVKVEFFDNGYVDLEIHFDDGCFYWGREPGIRLSEVAHTLQLTGNIWEGQKEAATKVIKE